MLLFSIAINVALVAAVIYAGFFAKNSKPPISNTPGASIGTASSGDKVEALGRIQPTNGLIGVFGPPGERVIDYKTQVGNKVEAGAVLGVFSGEDERKLAQTALEKQIDEAKALKKAIESSRDAKLAEIDAEAKQAEAGLAEDKATIVAKVRAAQARRKNALEERDRLERVRLDGVRVSEQELSQFTLVVELAEAEMAGADAQLKKIDAQQAQSKESIRAKKVSVEAEATRAAAQVPLASLEAAQSTATRKLQNGTFLAPTAGTVVRIMTKPGETISTMPILQLADTTRMGVLAEVYETDVGRLREWLAKGPVTVEVEARPITGTSGPAKPLRGTVTGLDKVSTVIAKNVLTPLGPREDADRRVVEVLVDLEPTPGIENYIGVQVRARFVGPK